MLLKLFFRCFHRYLGISRSTASIILIILPVALILAGYPAGLLGIKLRRQRDDDDWVNRDLRYFSVFGYLRCSS